MSLQVILFFITFFLLAPCTFAGLGIFTGSDDATACLSNSEPMTLLSEDVIICPKKEEPELVKLKGVTQIWLNFACSFKIKNEQNIAKNIQLGFPLFKYYNNEYFLNTMKSNVLDFKVLSAQKSYETKFLISDKDKNYACLFLWNMSFAPDEEKSISISYSIPLLRYSEAVNDRLLTAGNTIDRTEIEYLYDSLAICNKLWIEYVVVHKSFRQTMSKTITIQLADIAKKLELKESWRRKEYEVIHFRPTRPYIFAYISPDKYCLKEKKGIIYWNETCLNNNLCKVEFYRTVFPRYFEKVEVEKMLDYLIKNIYGHFKAEWIIADEDSKLFNGALRDGYIKRKNRAEKMLKYPNLEKDLRDITYEFYGEKTNNKNIQSFLDKQIWYNAEKKEMNGLSVFSHTAGSVPHN